MGCIETLLSLLDANDYHKNSLTMLLYMRLFIRTCYRRVHGNRSVSKNVKRQINTQISLLYLTLNDRCVNMMEAYIKWCGV